MTDRVWRALKFDNFYASYEWSPDGVPRPGDRFSIATGSVFIGGGTFTYDNIESGIELAGADAASQPTLVVHGTADVDIAIRSLDYYGVGYGTVKIAGHPHVDILLTQQSQQAQNVGVVEIAGYSTWSGGVHVYSGTMDVVGDVSAPKTSLFDNEDSAISAGYIRIDPQVVGVGTFDVSIFGRLIFNAGVSSGQTITNQGVVTINDVKAFQGFVENDATYNDPEVRLVGLRADMWSYADNHLLLFDSGTLVKDLHIQTLFDGVKVSHSDDYIRVTTDFFYDGPGLHPVS